MDADIVAATTAGAATTRTPFDDDDPEMIEDPNYGTSAVGSPGYNAASLSGNHYYNAASAGGGPTGAEYEPSQFSTASPGYAGMGAYGPAAAAGGAAAAAGGAGAFAYYTGQHQNGGAGGYGQDGGYYDPNQAYSQEGGYYPTSPQQLDPQNGAYSQGHMGDAQYATAAGGAPWGTSRSPPPMGEGMPFSHNNGSPGAGAAGNRMSGQDFDAQLLAPGTFSDGAYHASGGAGALGAGGVPGGFDSQPLTNPHASSSNTAVGMSGANGSTGSLKDEQEERKFHIANQ